MAKHIASLFPAHRQVNQVSPSAADDVERPLLAQPGNRLNGAHPQQGNEAQTPTTLTIHNNHTAAACAFHEHLPNWASFTNKDVQLHGGCVCFRLPDSFLGPVLCCTFSSDASLVAACANESDPRVLVFSCSTGSVVWQLEGHTCAVRRVAFCQHDKVLVSGSEDGGCLVWDMQTGKMLRKLGHNGPVHDLDVSADGRLLACSVPKASEFVVWALEGPEYRQVMRQRTKTTESGGSARFSQDSKLVAAGVGTSEGRCNAVALWDVATGLLIADLEPDDKDLPSHQMIELCFSACGTRFVTCHLSHTQVWDITNCRRPVKHQLINERLCGSNGFGCLSHGGLMLAGVNRFQNTVGVYTVLPSGWQKPLDDGDECPQLISIAHPEGTKEPERFRWSPDDRMVLTTGKDGECFIWSTESGALMWDLSSATGSLTYEAHGDSLATCKAWHITAVAFAPDSRSVVLGLACGALLLLHLRPKCPSMLGWVLPGGRQEGFELSQDGSVVVTFRRRFHLQLSAVDIRSTSTGNILHSTTCALPYGTFCRGSNSLAVSADGQLVAAIVGEAHDVAVWSVKHGMTLEATLSRASLNPALMLDNEYGYWMAISPSGRSLALVAREAHSGGQCQVSLHIWDVVGGKLLKHVPDIGATYQRATVIAEAGDATAQDPLYMGAEHIEYSVDGTALLCVLDANTDHAGAQWETCLLQLDTLTWEELPQLPTSNMLCSQGLHVLDATYTRTADRVAVCYTPANERRCQDFYLGVVHARSGAVEWVQEFTEAVMKVSWCASEELLMVATSSGLVLVDAKDGAATQRLIQGPEYTAMRMAPDGRTLVGLHTDSWKLSLAAPGSELANDPRECILVSTLSVYSCSEVAPDFSQLRFRQMLWLPRMKALHKLLEKFPVLLHGRDWDGVSLAAHALQTKNMKLLDFCLQKTPYDSHMLQWSMPSSPGSSIAQYVESGNRDFMHVLLQALLAGKLMGCKADHTRMACPILCWAVKNDAAMFFQYLQDCLVVERLTYYAPAESRLAALLPGVVDHPAPVPVAAVWHRKHGSVKLVKRLEALREGVALLEQHVEAVMVPLRDIACPGSNNGSNKAGTILDVIVQADISSSVYHLEFVRAVLEAKWEVYGKRLVVQELVLHLLLMAAFSAFCLLLPTSLLHQVAAKGRVEWHLQLQAACALLCLAAALMARAATCEARQWLATGLHQATASLWNVADLVSIALFFAVLGIFFQGLAHPTRISPNSMQAFLVLTAVEAVLLWSRVLHYMCAFKRTGPMVRMVIAIMQDMRYFLVLLACLACGFGVAFYLLFAKAAQHSSDIQDAFATIPRTMLTMLSIMVGGFDQSLFWKADAPWLAVLLFAAYVLVMLVVLFNLLIAIMGDSFEKVKDTEDNEFLKGRAQVLLEVETMQSSRRLARVSQAVAGHVHFLRPGVQAGGSGSVGRQEDSGLLEWQGKLKEAERRNRAMLDGLRAELLADVNSISSDLESKMADRIEELRKDMQQQHEQLQDVLKAVLAAVQS